MKLYFISVHNDHLLEPIDKIAFTGRTNSMPTIMIGKILIWLPAMYEMNKFIGTCLSGPNAMSHDRLVSRLLSSLCTLSAAIWLFVE